MRALCEEQKLKYIFTANNKTVKVSSAARLEHYSPICIFEHADHVYIYGVILSFFLELYFDAPPQTFY